MITCAFRSIKSMKGDKTTQHRPNRKSNLKKTKKNKEEEVARSVLDSIWIARCPPFWFPLSFSTERNNRENTHWYANGVAFVPENALLFPSCVVVGCPTKTVKRQDNFKNKQKERTTHKIKKSSMASESECLQCCLLFYFICSISIYNCCWPLLLFVERERGACRRGRFFATAVIPAVVVAISRGPFKCIYNGPRYSRIWRRLVSSSSSSTWPLRVNHSDESIKTNRYKKTKQKNIKCFFCFF